MIESSLTEVTIVPCEFRKAHFKNDNFRGFWVTLWLLIVYEHGNLVTHSFLHQSDMVDNCNLVDELGFDYTISKTELLVTPTHMADLFNSIDSYVSKSYFD